MGIKNIHYKQGSNWQPLPQWCRFFIELGFLVAQESRSKSRLVVGVTLPLRAWAAAFTAAGVVEKEVYTPTTHLNIYEHFEKLCQLEPGTPLGYLRHNRILRASLVSVLTFQGIKYLKIQIQERNKVSDLVTAEQCLAVTPYNGKDSSLPIYQRGHKVNKNHNFLDNIYFDQNKYFNPFEFENISTLACLLVGSKKIFHKELVATEFGIPPVKKKTGLGFTGNLQDLLRVKSFLEEGECYKSEIISSNTGKCNPFVKDKPKTVIFDGSTSYLKWGNNWTESHQIILLDRTEADFKSAAETLNNNFMLSRTEEEWDSALSYIPSKIEVMAYRELTR